MSPIRLAAVLALTTTLTVAGQAPAIPGIRLAMQELIAANEITGAVTAVVSRQEVLHLDALGFADVAAERPMTPDTLFWIASMTKPFTRGRTAAGCTSSRITGTSPACPRPAGHATL